MSTIPPIGPVPAVVTNTLIASEWGNAVGAASRGRVVQRFNTSAERDANITAPVAGMLCYLAATDTFYGYTAAAGWAVLPTGDTGWQAPAFTNSWANAAGGFVCGYRLIGKVVRLTGAMAGGAQGSAAFVLPAGYRPTHSSGGLYFATYSAAATFGALNVSPAGQVIPTAGNMGLVSLDAVSFTID